MRLTRPMDFARRSDLLIGLVMKHATFELWNDITRRNPVDTGRSRANWNVAVNTPDTSTRGLMHSKGSVEPLHPFPSLPAIRGTDTVHITNNLPYIRALESGHSRQAPNGFVQLAVDRVVPQFQKILTTAAHELGV